MKNKIDINSLSPEEQRLFRLYGKLPSRSDHFAKHLKDRKYFDSGDYALYKAGKADSVDTGSVGSQHPQPENIPHLTPTGDVRITHHSSMPAGSPVKESSFLTQGTTAEDLENGNENAASANTNLGVQSAAVDGATANGQSGIPIRR